MREDERVALEVERLAHDVDRLRRRGEHLSSELIHRTQPVGKAAYKLLRSPKATLAVLALPILAGLLVCVGGGVLAGVVFERVKRARHRRRSPIARLLAGLEG